MIHLLSGFEGLRADNSKDEPSEIGQPETYRYHHQHSFGDMQPHPSKPFARVPDPPPPDPQLICPTLEISSKKSSTNGTLSVLSLHPLPTSILGSS